MISIAQEYEYLPTIGHEYDIDTSNKYWMLNNKDHGIIAGELWEFPKTFDKELTYELLLREKYREKAIKYGWILATWYSDKVNNEIGFNHIDVCTPIPEYLFNYLRKTWKSFQEASSD